MIRIIKWHVVTILMVSCIFLPIHATASINVKDFGAKGDGITDDTASIQKAVDTMNSGVREYWNNIRGASYPEIVFPEGNYRISKPIVFYRSSDPQDTTKGSVVYALVRGDGRVVINQTDPEQDAFYLHWAFRVMLDNLHFNGGRSSLRVNTRNIDTANVVIQNCSFRDTRDYAITCTIHQNKKGEFVNCYSVGAGNSITYIDDPSADYLYNSTLLHINGCSFINCMRVLHSNTDSGTMDNCRIETNPDMVGAAITNGNRLMLDNVQALFHLKKGNNQRLVDFTGQSAQVIILRNCKTKTDSSIGVCPIYSFVRPTSGFSTWSTTSIILEQNEFQAAGCPENAVVYCESAPSLISIRNCKVTGGKAVPALGFPTEPDRSSYTYLPDGAYSYTIDDSNRNIIPNLPPSMRPHQRKPLSKKGDKDIRALLINDKEKFLSESGISTRKPKTVNVLDFGAKGDNITDDTEAFIKAIRVLADSPGGELRVPGKTYRISRMIDLPADITIRGEGLAVFYAAKPGQGCFRAVNAKRIAIYNCGFDNVAGALDIKVSGDSSSKSPARILVKRCTFTRSTDAAVRCIAGDMRLDGSSLARLRITDSMFLMCRQSLVSNVSSVMDNTWITTEHVTKESRLSGIASIQNHGYMLVEGMMGVPIVKTTDRGHRWIDNFGRLSCNYVRFGGETGGLCTVYVHNSTGAQKNVTAIQNSWLYNQDKVPAVHIYCEANPGRIILRTNVGTERFDEDRHASTVVMPNNSKVHSSIEMSGNTIPESIGSY